MQSIASLRVMEMASCKTAGNAEMLCPCASRSMVACVALIDDPWPQQ